ncbi:MAG: TrkH family potassium uptake protein, partial [Clostridiaceae bacterium]|nr:TrkH family potassium uptake protein [Clostridiaceae bacterium]
AVNFSLYYALFNRKIKEVLRSEELRWYLGIIALAVAVLLINTRGLYSDFFIQLRDVFFTVTSIISTTGYTVTDFNTWPLLSHIILLCLMFVGGMAGSTAGGIKVSRIVIYVKSAIAEVRSSLNPNRRVALSFESKTVSRQLKSQVSNYLSIYILIFVVLLLIVSLNTPNFEAAFSAVAATFNNVGPALDVFGPSGNFGIMSVLSKVALSIGMIMGRLEIIPILILFSPKTWRRT